MSKPRALGSTFDDHDEGTIETIQYLTITSSDIRPLTSDLSHCARRQRPMTQNIHLALFSSQVYLTSQTIRSLPGHRTLELSVIRGHSSQVQLQNPRRRLHVIERDRERRQTDVSSQFYSMTLTGWLDER